MNDNAGVVRALGHTNIKVIIQDSITVGVLFK